MGGASDISSEFLRGKIRVLNLSGGVRIPEEKYPDIKMTKLVQIDPSDLKVPESERESAITECEIPFGVPLLGPYTLTFTKSSIPISFRIYPDDEEIEITFTSGEQKSPDEKMNEISCLGVENTHHKDSANFYTETIQRFFTSPLTSLRSRLEILHYSEISLKNIMGPDEHELNARRMLDFMCWSWKLGPQRVLMLKL